MDNHSLRLVNVGAIRTKCLVDQNPYLPPDATDSYRRNVLPSGMIPRVICVILASCFGFASNSGLAAAWLERPILSFMDVFTVTAGIFAVVGAYLLIRRGGTLTALAVYGAIATFLIFVRSPNYSGAAKLIAVQSILQMVWTVIFIFLATPWRDSRLSG